MISFSELIFMQKPSASAPPANNSAEKQSLTSSSSSNSSSNILFNNFTRKTSSGDSLDSTAWNMASWTASLSSSSSSEQNSPVPNTTSESLSQSQSTEDVPRSRSFDSVPIEDGRNSVFSNILKGSYDARADFYEAPNASQSSPCISHSSSAKESPGGEGSKQELSSSGKICRASKPPRKISFSNRCAVILIPTRKEYVDAGLNLWVSREEQEQAQHEVKEEVRGLLDYNPALSIRMATSYLYQPKHCEDDHSAAEEEEEFSDDERDDLGINTAITQDTSEESSPIDREAAELKRREAVFTPHNTTLNSTLIQNISNFEDRSKNKQLFSPFSSSSSSSNSSPIIQSSGTPLPSSSRHHKRDTRPHFGCCFDTKQRLNIMIADVSNKSFERTKSALKSVLKPYERWVISCTHCKDDTEMLECLYKTCSSLVSKFDVVIIDESICTLLNERHDEDVKSLMDDVKYASDDAVVGVLLNRKHCVDHVHFKEDAKRGHVDFIWKKPITKSVSMLPMILTANQAKKLHKTKPGTSVPLYNMKKSTGPP